MFLSSERGRGTFYREGTIDLSKIKQLLQNMDISKQMLFLHINKISLATVLITLAGLQEWLTEMFMLFIAA